MKRLLIALALLLCAAIVAPAAAKDKWPSVIQLPTDFQPEGITTAKRHAFFVGSRETGAVYRGSLRSGDGDVLVEGGDDRQATGIKVDRRNRLFVSGAASKAIHVYDARTGDEIRSYAVPGAGFINDVILTRRGAYFTDSQEPQLYFIPFERRRALGELETIPITGDFEYVEGFNANGIEAAKGGRVLISVQSATGKLFAIDPQTGDSDEIVLDEPVVNGDGILREGRRLFVVRNTDNLVSVLKLRRDLSAARTLREIDSERFNVPTTIAAARGREYVVNAKFGQNTPDQTYEVVKVPRR